MTEFYTYDDILSIASEKKINLFDLATAVELWQQYKSGTGGRWPETRLKPLRKTLTEAGVDFDRIPKDKK